MPCMSYHDSFQPHCFFSFRLEGKDFVDAIEYLMDPRDKEKLHCLLSDESWERFVAAANVSR